ELAELLNAPVIDDAGRMNFPNRHPLNQSFARRGLVAGADLVLGLEVTSLYSIANTSRQQLVEDARQVLKPGAKLISIGADGLLTKGNFLDMGRYQPVDL